MSEAIVITSGKGGVGKTTTTANLGYSIAKLGYSVLLIDTDIGLRNLDVVMGLENRIVYNLVDVIEGNCKPSQAIIKDRSCAGLSLLPAAQTRDKTSVQPEQMKKLVSALKPDYDYILIDCPAGIERGFKNAIAAADRAIIVTTPEVSAIRDADRIVGLLNSNEMRRIDLIINRIRMDMIKRGDMMTIDDVSEILGINLIGSIYDDEAIVVSSNRGEYAAGCSKILSEKYSTIARRITGLAIEEDKYKGFFSWFKKKDKNVHKVQSEGL